MSTADDVEAAILNNLDAFGRLGVRGETNEADLAAHYPASPERYRIYVDGTRQFYQYASDPTNPSGIPYKHATDVHELSPAAGETVTFYTAERFRYVVQYIKALSWAMEFSRDLEAGEYVIVGAVSGTPGSLDPNDNGSDVDGWPIKYGPDIAPDGSQVEAYETRAGTIKDTETLMLANTRGEWARYLQEPNWYNVGNNPITETYTRDGQQINEVRGRNSVDKDRGPESGNVRVAVEVHAASSGLTVDFGSVGVATRGDVGAITKPKGAEFTGLSHSGGGGYEPLVALRIDPSRDLVNIQLTRLDPLATPGTADQLLAVSVDPSKTDADFNDPDDDGTSEGARAPPEHNDANSALQFTKAVSTIPDSGGSVVSSATEPGGWQVGHTASRSDNKNDPPVGAGQTRKRAIGLDGDVTIILGKSGTSGNFDVGTDTTEDS